jgi:hypothetical protein
MTQEQLRIFIQRIEMKNSWGKDEILMLILNVLAGRGK